MRARKGVADAVRDVRLAHPIGAADTCVRHLCLAHLSDPLLATLAFTAMLGLRDMHKHAHTHTDTEMDRDIMRVWPVWIY